MTGKLYGVGVGPGDPELMTVKAINTIKKCNVIAFSGKSEMDAVAYNIALQMVPEIEGKILLPLEMPMTFDESVLDKAHQEAVKKIETYILNGDDVAFLVLGDVTVYSTFMYLKDIIESLKFDVEIISGITSFCAAAAASGISLCQWDEKLIVVPSRHEIPEKFEAGNNYVLMKAGSKLVEIKEKVRKTNREVVCVENCGMIDEKVYVGVDNIPDKLGYYTIVIVK